MGSVVMIIRQIFADETSQVFLIERDHVIQHLSAITPDPTLRDSILPRSSDARAHGLNAGGLQEPEQIASELGVTVEQHVPAAARERQSFPQLLYDPIAGRMRRGIEVQDSPTIMLNDK
jgi:hypothetical protein